MMPPTEAAAATTSHAEQKSAGSRACQALVFAMLPVVAFAVMLIGISAAWSHPGAGTHPPSGHLDHRSLPTCEADRVLNLILRDTSNTGAIPYQHPIEVTAIDRIQQTRHVGSMGPGLRERRWCTARLTLDSHQTRTVWYLIEGYAGFAGIRFGVESCVAGRDLWNVYGGDCSVLRTW